MLLIIWMIGSPCFPLKCANKHSGFVHSYNVSSWNSHVQPPIHLSWQQTPSLSESVTCLLSWKHCTDHHVHPIDTFFSSVRGKNPIKTYSSGDKQHMNFSWREHLSFLSKMSGWHMLCSRSLILSGTLEKRGLTRGQVRSRCGIRPNDWPRGDGNVNLYTDGLQMVSRDND